MSWSGWDDNRCVGGASPSAVSFPSIAQSPFTHIAGPMRGWVCWRACLWARSACDCERRADSLRWDFEWNRNALVFVSGFQEAQVSLRLSLINCVEQLCGCEKSGYFAIEASCWLVFVWNAVSSKLTSKLWNLFFFDSAFFPSPRRTTQTKSK